MQARHVLTLAAGLFALSAVGRPLTAQRPQVEQPEITVYKVPT